jgi:CheY-like chemotaxis protein
MERTAGGANGRADRVRSSAASGATDGLLMMSVLLVDAHVEFRSQIRTALSESGMYQVVGEASTPGAAIDLARHLRPDVVVVDVDLPHLAGSDAIAHIRAEAPRARIVISARTDRDASAEDRRSTIDARDVDRMLELVREPHDDGDPAVAIALPNDPASVARARRFVRSWCRAWDESAIVESTLLVVSELVTNAITHGGGLSELRLRLTPDVLRIEVLDAGIGSPEVTASHDTDEGGRGLRIVTMISRGWGVDTGENGSKVIWSELARVAG